MRYRFGGPVVTVPTPCSSSSDTVAVAFHPIHAGAIAVALVTGLVDWAPYLPWCHLPRSIP
jgi:acetyl-CoA acetyltransferase